MVDFYYEIADVLIDKRLYKNKYYVSSEEIPNTLMIDSCRVWGERDGHVWWVKHRSGLPHEILVDMKEFMWVKLTAKAING